jgi:hypothetical protein
MRIMHIIRMHPLFCVSCVHAHPSTLQTGTHQQTPYNPVPTRASWESVTQISRLETTDDDNKILDDNDLL